MLGCDMIALSSGPVHMLSRTFCFLPLVPCLACSLILIVGLNVVSQKISLTSLYKMVPSSFSEPLPPAFFTAWNHCVKYTKIVCLLTHLFVVALLQ